MDFIDLNKDIYRKKKKKTLNLIQRIFSIKLLLEFKLKQIKNVFFLAGFVPNKFPDSQFIHGPIVKK